MYNISEFSKLTGTTRRALHYYDQVGLLTPKKAINGYRQYSQSDLLKLQEIICLKSMGCKIKEIKQSIKKTINMSELLVRHIEQSKRKADQLHNTATLMSDALYIKDKTNVINWDLISLAIRALQNNCLERWFDVFFSRSEMNELNEIWMKISKRNREHHIKHYEEIVRDINSALSRKINIIKMKQIANSFYQFLFNLYEGKIVLMKKVFVTYRLGMLPNNILPDNKSLPTLSDNAYHYLIDALILINKVDAVI